MPEGQALVLGGGGVAGIAWMTGVLAGLADAGQDVTGADLLVGTSAGAAVAAQVGSGLPLDVLFERQVDPALQAREISVELDMEKFGAEFAELLTGMNSAESAQDAPVSIGGRRYVDGGIRSSDNADLAAGYARIVVLSPLGLNSPFPSPMPLPVAVERLRSDGSKVTVIGPDEASVAAMGINPLDPATRVPAAQAGRAQGRVGLPGDGTDPALAAVEGSKDFPGLVDGAGAGDPPNFPLSANLPR